MRDRYRAPLAIGDAQQCTTAVDLGPALPALLHRGH